MMPIFSVLFTHTSISKIIKHAASFYVLNDSDFSISTSLTPPL